MIGQYWSYYIRILETRLNYIKFTISALDSLDYIKSILTNIIEIDLLQ